MRYSAVGIAAGDIDLVYGDLNDLKNLYHKFERDFPENERKKLSHLEMLIEKQQYKLILAKHKGLKEIVGYALVFSTKNNDYAWLDYIAIEVAYRGYGFGTLILKKIVESLPDSVRGLFIEVEIPDKESMDYKEQLSRVRFYERLGAENMKIDYQLPTPEGGLPLDLFYQPIINEGVLPCDDIKKTITAVFEYTHSDIVDRKDILNGFVGEIRDFYIG